MAALISEQEDDEFYKSVYGGEIFQDDESDFDEAGEGTMAPQRQPRSE